jgi:hypothetical protein
MNNKGGKTIIIDDAKAFFEHLSFWHNKSDDECIELATNEYGLDAEQALRNMFERDFVTGMNNNLIEELKNLRDNEDEERYNRIIDDAYKNFKNNFPMKKSNPPKDYINSKGQLLTKEEFINKCKTDTEFSQRWGLKIEQRELSLEERAKWLQDNKGYDLLVGNLDHDHIREVVEEEAPTKLITITYNDKTIESYG